MVSVAVSTRLPTSQWAFARAENASTSKTEIPTSYARLGAIAMSVMVNKFKPPACYRRNKL